MIFQKVKSPFQAIKQEVQKVENGHFSKGINPWFWSKNGHFCNFYFQAIQARKMSFTIFQNEKTPFQAIETRILKSRKIDIFPKTMVVVQKWPFFHFFFQAIQPRKMSFRIFQNKKTPFYAIKTRSSNSRKIDIFPKELTYGFDLKMTIFPTCL